jgi:tRNA threonylcarbamoyladenosine biosynthesis protein TsaB
MISRPYTLALEAATYRGSVALLRGPEVVCERTLSAEDGGKPRAGRGEHLMPAIADCLNEAGVSGREDVGRIVCGAGPGSFTSLRIAGSVAKGLAEGYGAELFAVSSLALSVSGAKPPLPSGEYLSVLDAMRDEFYAARIVLSPDSPGIQIGAATLMPPEVLEELRAREHGVRVVGPGQDIEAYPHARGVARLFAAIVEAGSVDLASWEPNYGRLAEAQVRWEAAHGRRLAT